MFERKNPIIMGRIRLENIKEGKERDKFDGVVAHMEMRVRNGKRRKVCHLQCYTIICVLSIGALSGLILMAAQAEIALANRLKGNITDKLEVTPRNNSVDAKIEHELVESKNTSAGNISISINGMVTHHDYREIDAGNDSKNEMLDTHVHYVNTQIRGNDELLTDIGYTRPKRGAVADFIKDSTELVSSLGNVKNFMFSLIKPIFKSLGRNQNLPILESFTNRVLPQTGFQGHVRGNLIKQKVANGFYQQAIEILEKHRVKVDVNKVSELRERPTVHGPLGFVPSENTKDMSSATYKQCKKLLPPIDTLIMERLRSQTSVSTSLMQSLHDDIRFHIREELVRAESHLKRLREEADIIEGIVSELVIEHFWKRIAIIIVCGCTFIVCLIAVWAIKKCQIQQSECCADIIEKMESALEQICQASNTDAHRKALTALDYVDMSGVRSPSLSPGLSRALTVRR